MPSDMLGDLDRAKIVIANYHAFKLRERMELAKGGRLLLQGRGGDELNTLQRRRQRKTTKRAFAEFTEVYQMQDDFAKKVESAFNKMIESTVNEI